jgi:hypothetical protein
MFRLAKDDEAESEVSPASPTSLFSRLSIAERVWGQAQAIAPLEEVAKPSDPQFLIDCLGPVDSAEASSPKPASRKKASPAAEESYDKPSVKSGTAKFGYFEPCKYLAQVQDPAY